MDGSGQSRRDVFARLFQIGETQLYGMLRAAIVDGSKNKATTLVLPEKGHVWEVRAHKYLGYGDRFVLELDLRPRFFAILKSNPEANFVSDTFLNMDWSDSDPAWFVRTSHP